MAFYKIYRSKTYYYIIRFVTFYIVINLLYFLYVYSNCDFTNNYIPGIAFVKAAYPSLILALFWSIILILKFPYYSEKSALVKYVLFLTLFFVTPPLLQHYFQNKFSVNKIDFSIQKNSYQMHFDKEIRNFNIYNAKKISDKSIATYTGKYSISPILLPAWLLSKTPLAQKSIKRGKLEAISQRIELKTYQNQNPQSLFLKLYQLIKTYDSNDNYDLLFESFYYSSKYYLNNGEFKECEELFVNLNNLLENQFNEVKIKSKLLPYTYFLNKNSDSEEEKTNCYDEFIQSYYLLQSDSKFNFENGYLHINNLIKSDNLTKALDELCKFYEEEPLITNFKDSLYLLKINSEILSSIYLKSEKNTTILNNPCLNKIFKYDQQENIRNQIFQQLVYNINKQNKLILEIESIPKSIRQEIKMATIIPSVLTQNYNDVIKKCNSIEDIFKFKENHNYQSLLIYEITALSNTNRDYETDLKANRLFEIAIREFNERVFKSSLGQRILLLNQLEKKLEWINHSYSKFDDKYADKIASNLIISNHILNIISNDKELKLYLEKIIKYGNNSHQIARNIAKKLKNNQAAVQFFSTPKSFINNQERIYNAILYKKNSKVSLIKIGAQKEISEILNVNGNNQKIVETIYFNKRNELNEKIWSQINLENPTDLFIVSSGVINRINHELLLEDIRVYNLSSLYNINSIKNSDINKKVNFSFFSAKSDKNDLDFVKNEINFIDSILKNESAYEIGTIYNLNLSNFSPVYWMHKDLEAIHVASHAIQKSKEIINTESAISIGKIFSATKIRLSEYALVNSLETNQERIEVNGNIIASLDLNNVKLVILSACESAKGKFTDPYGSTGLTQAFKIAGVDNIISTLWPIDDESSYQFMKYFYKEFSRSKDAYLSLKYAKETMKKTDKSSPYYWGGFILIN